LPADFPENPKNMPPPPTDLAHYIGNADEFPILRACDFFNHAGVSPLPRRAGDALRRFADQYERRAYLESGFYRDVETLRRSAAAMINAGPYEIAFVKNTSEGIATVAAGLDWRGGDRVVTTAVEYPANMYPWMDVAKRHGVELVTVPEITRDDGSRIVPLESILSAADHWRTRLVALSHVEYASGQRHDLATIGQFCRDRQILFCVDAIQSMGVLPLDVRAMNVDFLSADGHKWLLGPEGAGVFFCRRELLTQLRPLSVGWMNVINDQDYGDYDFTLKPDARRFECGTHNIPGLLALKASVELLAAIGTENVAGRLKALTDRAIRGLAAKGYRIISPRQTEEWSGILSFTSPTHDHHQLWRTLRTEHTTELALREGRLRISAHFYNTEEQIDRLLANLPSH
jgi:selenocysteine lyase/cysteine desulfurase